MPTEGGYGMWWRVIHRDTKHARQSVLQHDKRLWRVVDRAWDRNEKNWRYTVVPA